MYSLDFKIVIIIKGEIVEAMPYKIILMMQKNQELSKIQRIRSQKASTIKFQDSRFKNNKVSRIKIQEQSRSRFTTQDSRIKRRLNHDKY